MLPIGPLFRSQKVPYVSVELYLHTVCSNTFGPISGHKADIMEEFLFCRHDVTSAASLRIPRRATAASSSPGMPLEEDQQTIAAARASAYAKRYAREQQAKALDFALISQACRGHQPSCSARPLSTAQGTAPPSHHTRTRSHTRSTRHAFLPVRGCSLLPYYLCVDALSGRRRRSERIRAGGAR